MWSYSEILGVRTSTYAFWVGGTIQSITAPKVEEDEKQQEDGGHTPPLTPSPGPCSLFFAVKWPSPN